MNACAMATVATAVWQKVLVVSVLDCDLIVHTQVLLLWRVSISSLRHDSRGSFDITMPEHACFYASVNQPQPRPSCSKLS